VTQDTFRLNCQLHVEHWLVHNMTGKLELSWNEDPRSIGIMEEVDEDIKFRPLIMLNFKFRGYISGENNPFRGYQLLIMTAGGNDFIITVSEREIQRLGILFLFLF
jgi:hypothetical protein